MLNKLRNKLTILAAVLTGSVVVAVCFLSFLLIKEQYANSRFVAFQIAAESVYTQWTLEERISAQWLDSVMEANDAQVILWENGIPMDYGSADMERGKLLRAAAPKESGYYTYGTDLCAWFVLDYDFGQRQILFWQNTEPEQAYFLKIGVLFAGIAFLSLCAVTGLCYLVAGKAIVPVQEAMERQEQFVASASHELRSPLTAIRTGLSVLKVSTPESRRHLELMTREGERMSRLIDELLILAGGGSLRRNYSPRKVALDTLLIDFADTQMGIGEKKGIALQIELPEDAVEPVRADADRIRQILAILTDNALRYAPRGTAVTLKLRQLNAACFLSVIDHGPGIPDSEKKKVFDRFYRGSASRSDPDHFGLGLSVARELARVHGGEILLADTPGGGATFTLKLPTES